jgi:hypothetical protein
MIVMNNQQGRIWKKMVGTYWYMFFRHLAEDVVNNHENHLYKFPINL